jgi:hypothetical protein
MRVGVYLFLEFYLGMNVSINKIDDLINDIYPIIESISTLTPMTNPFGKPMAALNAHNINKTKKMLAVSSKISILIKSGPH